MIVVVKEVGNGESRQTAADVNVPGVEFDGTC